MDDLLLDAAGNLVLSAWGQQIAQQAPFVYQVIAGEQREVASSYRLDEGGAVRFVLGKYDPGQPLVIDPVLSYATYLGGSNNDYAGDIAVDAEGNSYVFGTSTSTTLWPARQSEAMEARRERSWRSSIPMARSSIRPGSVRRQSSIAVVTPTRTVEPGRWA